MSQKTQDFLIVTTALQSTWGNKIPTIFLGEWCKKLSTRNLWSEPDFKTLPYHWADRKKLNEDHDYLENINESVLEHLTDLLNKAHKINLPKRSWRIIIGPWLYSFISVIWDRWETISLLNKMYIEGSSNTFATKVFKTDVPDITPDDFNQFRELLDSDWWNHIVFTKIFEFRQDININIREIEGNLEKTQSFNNDPRASLSLFHKLFSFAANTLDYFIEKISSRSQDYVIFHSYFPRTFLLKLYFQLGIFPRWHKPFKMVKTHTFVAQRNNLKDWNINPSNDFEIFLQELLPYSLPKYYLEGFDSLVETQKSLPDARVIFTSNAYIYNETFKIWSAFQVLKKSKLIISSHGGALDPLLNTFNHEEKIADTRVVWGQTWHENQIRLPPNKLHYKIKKYNQNGQISLVDYEASRYGDRCSSSPRGPLVLDVINSNIAFLKSLEKHGLISDIKIRSKGLGLWESKKRFEESFGKNILCKERYQVNTIKNSRLVICTYPQTTFAESMYSGVPTMLFYDESFWEVQPIYSSLIDVLEKANIIFTNQDDAVKHVLQIQDDPMDWWRSDQVKAAREDFNNICLTLDTKPVLRWKNFFQSLLDD